MVETPAPTMVYKGWLHVNQAGGGKLEGELMETVSIMRQNVTALWFLATLNPVSKAPIKHGHDF